MRPPARPPSPLALRGRQPVGRATVALLVVGLMASACTVQPPTLQPDNGSGATSIATSPTGVDLSKTSGPLQDLVERARLYRGNPPPLGVLIGTLLLAALVLGIVTLALAWRSPGP
jgi:hypothetical protein